MRQLAAHLPSYPTDFQAPQLELLHGRVTLNTSSRYTGNKYPWYREEPQPLGESKQEVQNSLKALPR